MASLAGEQWCGRSCFATLLMILGLWAVVPPVVAQEASATVTGVVSDPSGAAIPSAQINLTNLNTAVVRTTKTNNDGAYAFLNVVPGRYTVQASAGGFASVTQSAVTLEVNQTATFDFHLAVGDTKTSVTVEAKPHRWKRPLPSWARWSPRSRWTDLPLKRTNFTQLLTITPGVANINRDQSGTGAGAGGGGFVGAAIGVASFPSINGARVRSNSFLLDGINDMNTFLTTYNFAPVIDDIQEFKTQGHNDLAEYGGVIGENHQRRQQVRHEPVSRYGVGVPA